MTECMACAHIVPLCFRSLLIHNVHHTDANLKAIIARKSGISVSYSMCITAIIPVIIIAIDITVIADNI